MSNPNATLEHVLPANRDPFEQRNGVTYCRRCGSVIVNDHYPDRVAKPCRKVKIELR